jgi:hypothetical protein
LGTVKGLFLPIGIITGRGGSLWSTPGVISVGKITLGIGTVGIGIVVCGDKGNMFY